MRIVTRVFLGGALLVGLSTESSGATLTVVPNKTIYQFGETISLSISGEVQASESAYSIFGRLQYTGAGAVTPASQTQKAVSTSWITGSLGKGATYSDSFNQIAGQIATSATSLPAKNPFSTVTLIASGVGLVNVNWNTATGSGFELWFFGLTNAPGTSFTIVEGPEPTTGALLALSLLGLAGWRRARA